MTQPSPIKEGRPPSPSPSNNKRTLYMFFNHAVGSVRHSLFAVEIPDPLPLIPSKDSHTIQLKNPKPLAPTLLFPSNEFSHRMCCVQLDSKLYFLGGEQNFQLYKHKERKTFFPPTVYIFEPAAAAIRGKTNASDFLTEGACMKTGKNDPILFVASGKIYALCGPLTKLEGFHLDCFEVFDPTNNTWASLPPPPFQDMYLQTHAVVNTKLYILAVPCLSFKHCIYCFDLNKNEWIPSSKLNSPPSICATYQFHHSVEDTIYALSDSTVVALGPVKDADEDGKFDGDFLKRELSFLPEGPRNFYGLHPFMVHPTSLLTHLENRQFCYVMSGNPPLPPLSESYEDTTIDPRTRYISVTIFDALSDTSANKHKAKFLYDAHFVAQTPWDQSVGILRNSWVIPV